MNSLELKGTWLKGNWNVIKGTLKQQYATLTDNDLILEDGAEDELLGRLQVKLGKTKEEILAVVQKTKQLTF